MRPNIKVLAIAVCMALTNYAAGQSKSSIHVYDFNDKVELSEFSTLKLDDSHPNLLNPEISGDDLETIIDSWSQLHQEIGDYLAENNFEWDVSDPSINIVHKIYFTQSGEIKHYFFRVLNDNVSEATREKYAGLLQSFSESHSIHVTRENPFAQCGKTKYLNE